MKKCKPHVRNEATFVKRLKFRPKFKRQRVTLMEIAKSCCQKFRDSPSQKFRNFCKQFVTHKQKHMI